MGAPPGLFDFHTEAQEIRKNFPKDWKKRLQQLKERAKATKYFYNDRQTLMVAVDLYNCSNKVYVNGDRLLCPT
jgi:sulfur transfer protein SufE